MSALTESEARYLKRALTESEARYLTRVETVAAEISRAIGGSLRDCRAVAANVIRELDKVDADVS